MTRTMGALAGHVAGTAHTRARMLRIDLADGAVLAITDFSRDLGFDLGDGEAVYSAHSGIVPSDLALSTGFDPDDIEITGPVTDSGLTTRAALLGGRFDDATVRLFQVDWGDLAAGAIRLLKGTVVRADVAGGRYKLTAHSEIGKFAQTVGRTITAYCENGFGDARCTRTRIDLAATVIAATDERQFQVSFAGTYADGFFDRGTVAFLTGALAGARPVEVFAWQAGGTIDLWAPLAAAPAVGDTLEVRQGCYDPASGESKTRAACKLMGGDAVPLRGFPDAPGSDQVLKYANPGG